MPRPNANGNVSTYSPLESTISNRDVLGGGPRSVPAKPMLKRRRPIFGTPAWAIHCFVEKKKKIAYVKAEQT